MEFVPTGVIRSAFRAMIAIAFFLATDHHARAAAPEWLAAAMQRSGTATSSEDTLDILRRDMLVTVSADGSWERRIRYVLRINHPTPNKPPVIGAAFIQGADEIVRAEAWLCRAGGTIQTFKRRDWIDKADDDGTTLYSDFRSIFAAAPMAAAGDVFGGEVVLHTTAAAGQEVADFRSPYPTRETALEVRIPKGWSLQSSWLSRPGPDPVVSADHATYRWTMRDVPAEKKELWSGGATAPRLGLAVVPPAGRRRSSERPPQSWTEVASRLFQIQEPQCDRNAALANVAAHAVRGLDSIEKKIEALDLFVRKLRYIEVNRNDGLGFGYRPHRATEVLAADCGDCKDKSNLLKALLRETNLQSHLVAVKVGDPGDVSPNWPSPQQFNHAIVAIELPPGAAALEGTEVPGLGRVLFVDPTDTWLPAGHLSWSLQGSVALICDPRVSGPIRLPIDSGKKTFFYSANARFSLGEYDQWNGELEETTFGELAAREQAEEAAKSERVLEPRRREHLGNFLAEGTVEGVTESTATDGESHTTTIRFKPRRFGQWVGPDLRIFDLEPGRNPMLPIFPDEARQHELLIPPLELNLEVTLDLPAGWRPELPEAIGQSGEFGHFSRSFSVSGPRLIYRRTVALRSARLPPARYREFRRFVTDLSRLEHAAIFVHVPVPP
jgi:hypothetical protein